MKYEYTILRIYLDDPQMIDKFNQLGQQGWQLINYEFGLALFMRAIQESNKKKK